MFIILVYVVKRKRVASFVLFLYTQTIRRDTMSERLPRKSRKKFRMISKYRNTHKIGPEREDGIFQSGNIYANERTGSESLCKGSHTMGLSNKQRFNNQTIYIYFFQNWCYIASNLLAFLKFDNSFQYNIFFNIKNVFYYEKWWRVISYETM